MSHANAKSTHTNIILNWKISNENNNNVGAITVCNRHINTHFETRL